MAEPSNFVSNLVTHPYLRLIHVNHCVIDERWDWAELRSPYWRLYLNTTAGARICQPGQRPFAIPPNHLVAVPAWLSWAAQCTGQVEHFFCEVELVGLTRAAYRTAFDRPINLGTTWTKEFTTVIAQWCGGDKTTTVSWRLQTIAARVFEAISLQQADLKQEGLALAADDLRPTMGYIDQHLHRPLVIQELADFYGASPATLRRVFIARLGCSPGAYVRERRIAVAAEWLTGSTDSIEDIATRIGFSDRQALTKAFTAVMGRGPAAYRKSMGMG